MTLMDARSLTSILKNLIFLHDIVVASEELLREASLSCKHTNDQFSRLLYDYYQNHLIEEVGHLQWLKDDLASANVDPEFPNRFATTIVGAQYYLIKHVHPASLLGYLIVMEGDPISAETLEYLEKIHGNKLFGFLQLHSTKDIEHRRELFEVIDMAPCNLHKVIEESLLITLQELVCAAREWRIDPSRDTYPKETSHSE